MRAQIWTFCAYAAKVPCAGPTPPGVVPLGYERITHRFGNGIDRGHARLHCSRAIGNALQDGVNLLGYTPWVRVDTVNAHTAASHADAVRQ
ncbi:hypothetical protein FHX49_001345 [Microbacterium endophyticum]|uniref:Uncharacterized protein n=1 Tax=Microbacterium endophyticum TaxID=1526412 RepID=A0A7W4V2Q9_9MICO|nr:hypothetical protein [Microbacterium endophyticum]NIK36261.1 hypothetical protein [Microbacterium endophyticum]